MPERRWGRGWGRERGGGSIRICHACSRPLLVAETQRAGGGGGGGEMDYVTSPYCYSICQAM